MMLPLFYIAAMSKIPDIHDFSDTDPGMHPEERQAWAMVAVSIPAFVVYLVLILRRAQETPLAEVAYVGPMLWSIGGAIAAAILLSIILAILSRGESSDQRDQRDREIDRSSARVGHSLVVIGGLAALIMAMFELRHFWIANSLYLAFFLASLLEVATKIAAYRVGLQDA